MSTAYRIKTEVFEGPLDLLLSLIEKRKLLINDIALSKVADDYMGHTKKLERFPMGDVASFILVASTLVLIKSKSLLPMLTLTDEEQGDIQDLERRLRIYKRIKQVSRYVREKFGANIIFAKKHSKNIEPVFSPDEKISKESLHIAIGDVLGGLPKKEKVPQVVVKKVVSLEDVIDRLAKRIQGCLNMSFNEFSKKGAAEKADVIVSFLAMLELVKQGALKVSQENIFDDISIKPKAQ